jgi:hypothetical protein
VPETFSLLLDGSPVDDQAYNALSSLEVEENADLPDAIQLSFGVNATASGDLDYPGDSRLKPFANLALVVTPEGADAQCIFDGYVLSHRLHLESGIRSSTLQVWGQDASWLMNLEEKVHEWVDVTDSAVAASIFGDYGIQPADENSDEDSPSHTEDGHSLMQRATDIQFLRSLARRTGKWCRVFCRDKPGERVGFFAMPALDGDPVAILKLNDPSAPTMEKLDLEWDVTRPTQVQASQALFDDDDEDGASGDAQDSGLALLDERGLGDFSGRDLSVLLAAPVDAGAELNVRAQAVLRESGWFVRAEGEAEVSRVGRVLRVGDVVMLDGLGTLHSGKYLVWSVRHTIDRQAHRMRFTLRRNAVGPEPSSAPLGLPGGLP